MNITKIVLILLFLCVVGIHAARRCTQAARRPNCNDRRDEGRSGRFRCRKRTMWYYENGECRQMKYKGCRGNGNRFCSKADCERRCRRAG